MVKNNILSSHHHGISSVYFLRVNHVQDQILVQNYLVLW